MNYHRITMELLLNYHELNSLFCLLLRDIQLVLLGEFKRLLSFIRGKAAVDLRVERGTVARVILKHQVELGIRHLLVDPFHDRTGATVDMSGQDQPDKRKLLLL